MMKIILATVLLIISNFVFSQDYKKKIAKASCDCIMKVGEEIKDSKTREMKLGLCMITASMPYSNELKRDYNIDVDKIGDESDKSFEELGGKIGLLMATECSDVFVKMFADYNDTSNAENSELLLSGTVKKIEKDNFVIFHVVGENNNLTKFYWISNIESNLDLPTEYNSLVNKKINISYYTTEIFDAKINDYRNLNVISSLKTD